METEFLNVFRNEFWPFGLYRSTGDREVVLFVVHDITILSVKFDRRVTPSRDQRRRSLAIACLNCAVSLLTVLPLDCVVWLAVCGAQWRSLEYELHVLKCFCACGPLHRRC